MIVLQSFDKKDFNQLIAWATDAEVLMQFAGPDFTFPLTTAQLEQTRTDKNRLNYCVVHTPSGNVIGHAEIYFPGKSTAHFCRILIGDPDYRGKGLGLQLINQLLIISFAQPGIEEASLNVYDWNTAAIKCYEKAGFVLNSGYKKIQKINDQAWTTLNMRLSKKSWEIYNSI